MADIYVDGSNDIVFSAGDLVFTSDYSYGETVKSRLAAYLRTFLGEWFLDEKLAPVWGVPYWQRIFSDQRPSLLELDTLFRSAILSIDGIADVPTLVFEYDSRVLNVTFEAICSDGSRIEDVLEIGIGGSIK